MSGELVPVNGHGLGEQAAPPAIVLHEGKTPALSVEQARWLLTPIDTTHVVGLCDRAIIATLKRQR